MTSLRTIGIAGLAVLASGTAAHADAWSLIAANSTGKSIYKIEVAPSATTAWSLAPFQPNSGASLDNGERMEIGFDKPADKCRYDLRATFTDLSTVVYSGVNVCVYSTVTLKLVNGKASYSSN